MYHGGVRTFTSHGTGQFDPADLGALGARYVFEDGVLIFRPEYVRLGDNVYLGHRVMLKAYAEGGIHMGDDCWVGPGCMFSGAALIDIGDGVGIGPMVQILTSVHDDPGRQHPILDGPLVRTPVTIGAGSDLGAGSILLPGAQLGVGVQLGAGSVVTGKLPDYAVAAGSPARVSRIRDK